MDQLQPMTLIDHVHGFPRLQEARSFECACLAGYTGTLCERTVNAITAATLPSLPATVSPCAADSCLHGGTCIAQVDGKTFRCLCTTDFVGDRCETQKSTVAPETSVRTSASTKSSSTTFGKDPCAEMYCGRGMRYASN